MCPLQNGRVIDVGTADRYPTGGGRGDQPTAVRLFGHGGIFGGGNIVSEMVAINALSRKNPKTYKIAENSITIILTNSDYCDSLIADDRDSLEVYT